MVKQKEQLSPTVYGVETEYTCMMTFPDNTVREIVGSCHSVDSDLGLYVQPTSTGAKSIPSADMAKALNDIGLIRNRYGMLSNGGRFYIDPSGPEYDTPETSSAEDATHRTFEGDEIVLKVLAKLMDAEVLKDYQVNRRIVDHNRSSRGIHINTLTSLGTTDAERAPLALWIATLNVAKGALFGSGGLLVDAAGDTSFHHSPRLSITTDVTARYENYQLRPLVRTPFKPDESGYSRVETVSGDALNFGWPMRASLVMTNALIGLIELNQGCQLPILRGESAIDSAHNVGLYGSEGSIYLEEDGELKVKTAVDVLRRIAETMLKIDEIDKYLDKESSQVLAEVIEVADRVEEDKLSAVGQVESISRDVAMQRKMEKDGIAIDSERMCRFDYAWDWIGGNGIAETLRRNKNVGWQGFKAVHSPSVTKRRLITPPENTRARVRGEMIRVQNGSDDSTWNVIDFGSEARTMPALSNTVPSDIQLTEDVAEVMKI